MPVEHALGESSNPEIGFHAAERCDVKIAQRRVENRYFLSVVEQDAALPGSNQEMSGSGGQDRGNGARIWILRQNLAEGTTVEGQQAILRRGDDEFRFARIRQHRRSDGHQRRRGQLSSNRVMLEQGPAGVILREPGRACDVEVAKEAGGLEEYRRRAD